MLANNIRRRRPLQLDGFDGLFPQRVGKDLGANGNDLERRTNR
ncbi:MAG: hypothetical protein PHT80_00485 [Lentisphaeria bacterium]|nr:hypothetical protein [Lentisphaeria bacterium]